MLFDGFYPVGLRYKQYLSMQHWVVKFVYPNLWNQNVVVILYYCTIIKRQLLYINIYYIIIMVVVGYNNNFKMLMG